MSNRISIPVILGTAREGRQSEKVADAIVDILEQREDCVVQLIDTRVYTHYRTIPPWEENETTGPWREVAASSLHVSQVQDFEPDEKFRERVNKAADKLIEMIG